MTTNKECLLRTPDLPLPLRSLWVFVGCQEVGLEMGNDLLAEILRMHSLLKVAKKRKLSATAVSSMDVMETCRMEVHSKSYGALIATMSPWVHLEEIQRHLDATLAAIAFQNCY